jgi:hypothetical protein
MAAPKQPKAKRRASRVRSLPAATTNTLRPYFRIHNSSKDRVRIQLRAVWDELVSASTWTVNQLNFNPLSDRFGRVANMARSFEFFKVHSVKMHYIGACSTASTGQVLLRLDADAADNAPDSVPDFLNSGFSDMCAPYSSVSVEMKGRDLYQEWYACQPWSQVSERDPTTDDTVIRANRPFQLQVASVGGSGSVTGAMYLELDIEFKTPSEPRVGSLATGSLGASALPALATSWSTYRAVGPLGWSLASTAGKLHLIVRSPGQYRCSVSFQGSSLAPSPSLANSVTTTSTLIAAGGTSNYNLTWVTTLPEGKDYGYTTVTLGGTGAIIGLSCMAIQE